MVPLRSKKYSDVVNYIKNTDMLHFKDLSKVDSDFL